MLNKSEIQKLYNYVQKHEVKYVDVQVELVDHLASGIEVIRAEDPDIGFEDALIEASSQFDVKTYSIWPPSTFGEVRHTNGFKSLVNQKELETSKYLNRRMNDYALSFFKVPKIILTIAIWIIFYGLVQVMNLTHIMILVFIFQIFAVSYWGIRSYVFTKANGKFISVRFQTGTYLAFYLLLYQFICGQFLIGLDSSTIYFPILFSSLFMVCILVTYITYIYFTDLLISEIKEKYVEHNLNIV